MLTSSAILIFLKFMKRYDKVIEIYVKFIEMYGKFM